MSEAWEWCPKPGEWCPKPAEWCRNDDVHGGNVPYQGDKVCCLQLGRVSIITSVGSVLSGVVMSAVHNVGISAVYDGQFACSTDRQNRIV